MAEPTPRTQKLTWFKSLRGADLNSGEFRILVLLQTYSNAEMENAHPSAARLAEDAGLSERQVYTILDCLKGKGAIEVTQEGGKGGFRLATVYKILTPPQRSKGDTRDPLQADKSSDKGEVGFTHKDEVGITHQGDTDDALGGDKSADKGEVSREKGEVPRQTRVKPASYHQVNTSGPIDHSAPSVAASLAPQAGAHANGHESDDEIDLAAIEDALDAELSLTDEERRTVDGMLQRGMHPNAVRNKVIKARNTAVAVAVSKAQKQRRLDEEPRCKTCGIAKTKHTRWMAELTQADDPARHPFIASTVT
jgi:hypothetical protein